LSRNWPRHARAYVGNCHPLIAALLVLAALLKLWVAVSMLLGEHRDRPGYMPVLILAWLFFVPTACAAWMEIRKLLRPVSALHQSQLLSGVDFVDRAQNILDARSAGVVRGIDAWRALSIQLGSTRDGLAVFGIRRA
jgi:hypothetical protein